MGLKEKPWKSFNFLFILHFIQCLTSCLLVAGVSQHAQYGKNQLCLLFIGDYEKEGEKAFDFLAESPSCRGLIAAGATSIVISISLFMIQCVYFWKQLEKSRRMHLVLGLYSLMGALVMVCSASLLTMGLESTCKQFQTSGASCGIVFSGGFLEAEERVLHYRNLNMIYAAIGSAWVAFASYFVYGLYECFCFRTYLPKSAIRL